MMLRQQRASPPQCKQELPGCHFLPPAAAFSRLNRTQCRRPTDRARYQCCPHRSTLHWYSFCSVQSRHRDAVLQFARCSEAVILWQSSCYTEEDGAGGTQRGPSPGQAHRTRGGSSIYFLFCPNHQPWTRKNTRKLCPGPSIMKRKTSMKPTATLEEKKLALIAESKEDNPFFFANLLFIKCFQCFHFFHLISKQLYFYGTRVELVSSYFH